VLNAASGGRALPLLLASAHRRVYDRHLARTRTEASRGPWMVFGSGRERSALPVRLVVGCAVLLSACALLKSTPEEAQPAAPSAMEFRYLSPAMRDAMLPPPPQFQGVEYADRLICQSGEHPNWKRTAKKGLVETFEVQCPGGFADTVVLDTAGPRRRHRPAIGS